MAAHAWSEAYECLAYRATCRRVKRSVLTTGGYGIPRDYAVVPGLPASCFLDYAIVSRCALRASIRAKSSFYDLDCATLT